MLKERPILFSGPMVRAILDGRKTQTRRIIKLQPSEELDSSEIRVESFIPSIEDSEGELIEGKEIFGAYDIHGDWGTKFPYGKPGDRLWVRETWTVGNVQEELVEIHYRADDESLNKKCSTEWSDRMSDILERLEDAGDGESNWRPSIHMPRWASRITLEIKNVRVERLQEIREADAKAEGVGGKDTVTVSAVTTKTYKKALSIYWDNAHVGSWKNKVHKPGGRWSDNPWVWVIEFERVK